MSIVSAGDPVWSSPSANPLAHSQYEDGVPPSSRESASSSLVDAAAITVLSPSTQQLVTAKTGKSLGEKAIGHWLSIFFSSIKSMDPGCFPFRLSSSRLSQPILPTPRSLRTLTRTLHFLSRLVWWLLVPQAGWLPTLLMLTFFLFISCFSATLMCEAIRLLPGNHRLVA